MNSKTETKQGSIFFRIVRKLLWHDSENYFLIPTPPSHIENANEEGPFGRMLKMWGGRLYDLTGGTHPTPRFYVFVAVILAIITLAEYWVFTLAMQRVWINALLYALSTVKFVMVIGLFMHLKFDARLFRGIFAAGTLLGIALSLSVLALFFKLNG